MTNRAEQESASDETQARFLRQMDICPPDKLSGPIVVIGAGAVGSAVTVLLAKMGCANIKVWDSDTLEEHNIPNQMCYTNMIGVPKVEALLELVGRLSDVTIKIINKKYCGQRLEGVVIAAVDSMDARKAIWEAVKYNNDVTLFIDPRMGGEIARLYTILPNEKSHVGFYESNLYTSSEAEQASCSARAIIYCPSILAGYAAAQVKNFAVGAEITPELIIDIPGSISSSTSENYIRDRYA